MILVVSFQRPVTALEPWSSGCEEWRARDEKVKEYDMTCTEKGNGYIFEWVSRVPDRRGKRMRARVPLTNIASVLEVFEEGERP